MSIAPGTLLTVLLIGSRSMQQPTCDPAIDLDAPNVQKLLSTYERSRSDTDRAAIPLRPGVKPVLFKVQPFLNAPGTRYVKGAMGIELVHRAVQVCVHAYVGEDGVEVKASDRGYLAEISKGFVIANDAWVDELRAQCGDAGLAELAQIVHDRTEAGPRALTPFRLPPGLMLAR